MINQLCLDTRKFLGAMTKVLKITTMLYTPDEYFRRQYFEVLDTMIGEFTNLKGFLKHRYHSLFSKKLKRQSLIPVMASVHVELLESFQKTCEGDLDVIYLLHNCYCCQISSRQPISNIILPSKRFPQSPPFVICFSLMPLC